MIRLTPDATKKGELDAAREAKGALLCVFASLHLCVILGSWQIVYEQNCWH